MLYHKGIYVLPTYKGTTSLKNYRKGKKNNGNSDNRYCLCLWVPQLSGISFSNVSGRLTHLGSSLGLATHSRCDVEHNTCGYWVKFCRTRCTWIMLGFYSLPKKKCLPDTLICIMTFNHFFHVFFWSFGERNVNWQGAEFFKIILMIILNQKKKLQTMVALPKLQSNAVKICNSNNSWQNRSIDDQDKKGCDGGHRQGIYRQVYQPSKQVSLQIKTTNWLLVCCVKKKCTKE